ncbi:hypothetical protein [Flavobacterium pedocola]
MRGEIKNLAVENYKHFCSLEGSDYIASEFALATILQLISRFKAKKILELGMGIGSVSDTVLKFNKKNNLGIHYSGTEKNEFCLAALKNNVEEYESIFLFSELNQVTNKDFDFVIIDGLDESLKNIKDYCGKHAILFVEGDRKAQTQTILDVFPNSLYVNVITLEKNPSYAHEGRSVNSYKGGGQLIFTNPTLEMKWYWFVEKAATYIKRKIRKINRK